MNARFWKGKRVFVTGHTGFKGSWLALWLHYAGAEITGYALEPSTEPSLYALAGVGEAVTSIIGDVRDPEAISKAMLAAEPDIVLHLAAQSLVRRSYSEPVETYATNVMGTAHVLEAVRACASVRVALVVTSDKCYENREWVWGYREDEAMGGYDPYSSSKGCAELVTAAYRRSFFSGDSGAGRRVAVASARAGNVIGGGDWATDRLVPDMVRAFADGERPLIRNPDAIRPWQHVLEALSGYVLLVERLWEDPARYASGWNFGPGEEDARTVSWIADRLMGCWGDNAAWQVEWTPQPHEAHYLRLDCSKARTLLQWRPRLDLETALEWIVDWHKAHLDGRDMRAYTVQQIARYQERST